MKDGWEDSDGLSFGAQLEKLVMRLRQRKFALIGIHIDEPISNQPMSPENLLDIRFVESESKAMQVFGTYDRVLGLARLRGFTWFYFIDITDTLVDKDSISW